MDNQQTNGIFEMMIDALDIPDSAYERAVSRYQDLGQWLCRDGSSSGSYDPHVFPQGSFRLGTVNRPLDQAEAYDLDLSCELKLGITKATHTQESVKRLVGTEIESYRVARGIQAPKEEKHRCWRLEYADQISFHVDAVPCIPEAQSGQQRVRAAMLAAQASSDLADAVSALTVSITDDRHHAYRELSDDWLVSNPEGYALWFESRMRLAEQLLRDRAGMLVVASIDEVPVYQWKTPIQRVVQLLKRHRDVMFRSDQEVKPVSVIITTLAARAYQGEPTIQAALHSVLSTMGSLVNPRSPRVPNPSNPAEDFADRWARRDCAHLRLEENFRRWLEQAKADFELLSTASDAEFVARQAERKLSIGLSSDRLVGLGLSATAAVPRVHVISGQAPKPWLEADR